MPKVLVLTGAVFAWCLSLFAASTLFAGESGRLHTTPIYTGTDPEAFGQAQNPITLDMALQRALESSPQLAAFSREVAAREAEVVQAGLPPNPELSMETENIAGSGEFSGVDNAESTIRVNQRFELGGKRGLRRDLGNKALVAAQKEFANLKNEVLSRTMQRFYGVLSAQEHLALADEQIQLASRILETVEKRVSSGKSAAVEIHRFKQMRDNAQIRRETALQALWASRAALAASWDDAAPDFGPVDGKLGALAALPEWTELEARIDNTMAFQSARVSVEFSEQALALADAGRIPDLTVGLGLKNVHATDDNAAVIEVAIPLPVFDRNQGKIRAARERVLKSRENERRIRGELRAALAENYHRLQAVRNEAEALRSSILPAAEKTFKAIDYGYQSGKYGYLEVLEAERSLFEAKGRYVDALTTYHQLYAQMASLLGWKEDGRPLISVAADEHRSTAKHDAN